MAPISRNPLRARADEESVQRHRRIERSNGARLGDVRKNLTRKSRQNAFTGKS
jgi:hypothetical protein